MSGLAPRCPRCDKRHRPDLRCWSGRYVTRMVSTVLAHIGRVCYYCGGPATTLDHIVPRSRGGGDDLKNYRPACRRCNSARGNRWVAPPAVAGIDATGWFTS